MAEVVIPQGEVRQVSGMAPGYRIAVEGGPVYLGHNKSEVRAGRGVSYPEGFGGVIEDFEGKKVWGFAPESDVTVKIDDSTFSVRDTFQNLLLAPAQRTRAVATEIASQSVDLSADIVQQSVNQLDINIDGQSLGEITGNTARISAEGVTEVNADQTATIGSDGNGGSQTTVIRANEGEVWELRKVFLKVSPVDNSQNPRHYFEVETESENIEVAYSRNDNGYYLEYKSGSWRGNGTTTRDDLDNLKIDDTNGLAVTYHLTNYTQSDPRRIRMSFDVIQA